MKSRYLVLVAVVVGGGVLLAERGGGESAVSASASASASDSVTVSVSATGRLPEPGARAEAQTEGVFSREALDAEIVRKDYIARANRGELHGADFERFRRLLRRDAELNQERTEALLRQLPKSRARAGYSPADTVEEL